MEAWPAKGLTTDNSNPVHLVHPCFFPQKLCVLGDLCERPFLILLFSITIIRGSSFSQFLIPHSSFLIRAPWRASVSSVVFLILSILFIHVFSSESSRTWQSVREDPLALTPASSIEKKRFNFCKVEGFNAVTEIHFVATVDNATFRQGMGFFREME